MLTRRKAVSMLAAVAAAAPVLGATALFASKAPAPGGIRFNASGPNADDFGARDGYPAGWPIDLKRNRVGSYSHLDQVLITRQIKSADTASVFKRGTLSLDYHFDGKCLSINDYLERNPATGLIIAQDDEILLEAYQYGRDDRDRMVSQSMAKTITGLLIGIAIGEGAIKSVDDLTMTYVPEFQGSEYGRTRIRDLLHMSSGVLYREEQDGPALISDLIGRHLKSSDSPRGTIGGLTQFNTRVAPAGTHFDYASIETIVLGVVLTRAIGTSLSAYAEDRLWRRIGTESDASWAITDDGYEIASAGFSAVLRDYARLGRLLAHDGAWNGQQVVPAQWMLEATTARPQDRYLAPSDAEHKFGYGYSVWLLPWGKRQFALLGLNGQRICVDPASRLVLVQTGLEEGPEIWSLWNALVAQLGRA